ncbi:MULTISPECIES: class A beta-lactamase [unclassified Massilia]|uniref:class A beta-lactamase n=1 Tax=unclassified Massilia TaxID=2609279 RepID=UPI0017869BE3|nr:MULTISPECIES: class A beta-lactamase [unclassified Massilia]MBD8530376.1 class A beta-lactamase [Massilia sp. CFBP 13647]MBD8673153.1 class A beta-lactamase [Massilia sp. CFBP 13721]
MNNFTSRRRMLAALAAVPVYYLSGCAHSSAAATDAGFAALEKDLGGRLGVSALDTGSGRSIGYREHERFAMCSTFKAIAAAAILARDVEAPGLLQKRIRYSKDDLVTYSTVTEQHLQDGMTLEQLCAATVIHSDNSAGNLILRELGGPEGLTRFVRKIGDTQFRLDRWETELNTAYAGDPRDTTTPAAMTATLNVLLLGAALPAHERAQLTQWMRDCATGATRIRAGVPADWKVADKTGTGGYGSANDIGVIWPTGRAPIVLSVYTVQYAQDSKARNDIVAAATRLVAGLLVT